MAIAKTKGKKQYVSPAAPLLDESARPIQAFGHLVPMPMALNEEVRQESVDNLNQLLADSIMLREQ